MSPRSSVLHIIASRPWIVNFNSVTKHYILIHFLLLGENNTKCSACCADTPQGHRRILCPISRIFAGSWEPLRLFLCVLPIFREKTWRFFSGGAGRRESGPGFRRAERMGIALRRRI